MQNTFTYLEKQFKIVKSKIVHCYHCDRTHTVVDIVEDNGISWQDWDNWHGDHATSKNMFTGFSLCPECNIKKDEREHYL